MSPQKWEQTFPQEAISQSWSATGVCMQLARFRYEAQVVPKGGGASWWSRCNPGRGDGDSGWLSVEAPVLKGASGLHAFLGSAD